MKVFVLIIMVTSLIFSQTPAIAQLKKSAEKTTEISKPIPFTEGIINTRVSFPGNIMNELLLKIDFNKGDVPQQLQQLQANTNSKEYADKVAALLKTMTEEERAAMGPMVMGMMMSPLHAKIYCSPGKVFAKANALTYSLESFINISDGKGKMIVTANDKNSEAAIEFSAPNMRKVWEKEEVDAKRFHMKMLEEQEMVAGYACKKVIYTYKQQSTSHSTLRRPAYKIIVWYSPLVNQNINFLHPFYFELDKGILKIEVHYDKNGRNRLLYEVTHIEAKVLTENDFIVSDVKPVIDWDVDPEKASMNILTVMMSSMNKQ